MEPKKKPKLKLVTTNPPEEEKEALRLLEALRHSYKRLEDQKEILHVAVERLTLIDRTTYKLEQDLLAAFPEGVRIVRPNSAMEAVRPQALSERRSGLAKDSPPETETEIGDEVLPTISENGGAS